MEVAKVTSKGQITIPISIRRRLGVNEGDKVLFIYKPDGVLMVNPTTFQGEYGTAAESTEAVAQVAEPRYDAQAASVPLPAPMGEPGEASAVTAAPAIDAHDQKIVSRPVPPPVEEPDKPEPVIGDISLNTLLDEIRSIGSNI